MEALRANTLRPCLLVVCLILVGCQAALLQQGARARLDDEGGLYVYLQPLAAEAGRLRVTLESIAALPLEGGERPLALLVRELSSPDLRRQRLLAAGPLPAGPYSGFVVRVKAASLRVEGGEAALVVPEAPTRIDFKFTVRRGEAGVIAFVLDNAGSVKAGSRFSPTFSVHSPERPAVGVMGFVANSRSNDVSVFDKKSLQVFDVIATGRRPSGLALDQRDRRLYVALAGDDAVDVIDVPAGKILERVRLTAGDEPVELALTPDGTTVLSANRGSNTVSVIDAPTRFEVTKLRVGAGPRSVIIERNGRRAFVFNTISNTVSVIDVLSRSVFGSIPTDPGPVRGQFNRRGDRLYVIHEAASYVTAINLTTLSVTGRFPVRSPMNAIKVDPSTDFVYMAERRGFGVGVYDPFSFAPVDFLQTAGEVAHIATDGEDNTLYLVEFDANRVLVSERIRKRPVGALDVGDGPAWISVMGEN